MPTCPTQNTAVLNTAQRVFETEKNKLVRRKLPKGKSMAKVTQKQATEVQHWVNHYTRPMFGGKSAADMLKEELDKLSLYNREKVYRFFDLL